MAQSKKKTKSKTGTGGSKGPTSGFDKTNAIRVVEVPVTGAGVFSFPEDVTTANRVWVEWTPSALLEGKMRRLFLSKQGVRDPHTILTDGGVQVPRKGMSGSLEDRCAVVFGPGKVKVWIAAERRSGSAPVNVRELSSDLLSLVSRNNQTAPPSRPSVTSGSRPSVASR